MTLSHILWSYVINHIKKQDFTKSKEITRPLMNESAGETQL